MSVPKNIAPLQLNSLKGRGDDTVHTANYETHKQVIGAVNTLQDALRPGTPMNGKSFTVDPGMGVGAQITALSGTFKRGKFTLTTGASGFTLNPTVSLNFPQGTWDDIPSSIVTRNGGNGALGFTYAETINTLTITLNGTPTSSTTYVFQFAVRD